MSNEEYKSPAEESANKILQGIKIIQDRHPKVSLTGLDKGVFVGCCENPESDLSYTTEQLTKLKELGWSWSEEQESWEFYTGHG
jgi:hypothetical protein